MPINTPESTPPPPKIGKIGPYTVFITPPATPTPNSNGNASPKPDSPKKVNTGSKMSSPVQPPIPPPVQAPPMQIPKSAAKSYPSSSFGFFWDAVAKVQNAHASLDEHMAYWFGLDQSKYQWALDDYFESKGIDKKDIAAKMSTKV